MKLKRILLFLLSVTLIASMSFVFTACGPDEDLGAPGDVIETDAYEQLSNEEKADLAKKAKELNKDVENFYGTWEADKEEAYDLYGHLTITINENGTFDADVTDEIFSGTWTKTNNGIKYTSELMNGTICFGETCEMTIENRGYSVPMHKVD